MTKKTTVLVVEDEPDMAMGLRHNLEYEGYEVLAAGDGEGGIDIARENAPSCILLDIMLPGIDGFETCVRLRRLGIRAPIIMLTARGQEIDRVRGLELGADDYVTKPFGVQELLARIRAAIRRASQSSFVTHSEEVEIGDARVSFLRGTITRGEEDLPMGYYESEILRMLLEKPGEVVERQTMLKDIWSVENEPMNRSADNHVVSLRRKIETEPTKPAHILTVHGLGYKIVL